MKTLIIAAHPNLEKSVINKRWLTELRKHPDLCTIHTLASSLSTTASVLYGMPAIRR